MEVSSPVSCPVLFRAITANEFAELDYCVMKCAYACQNELGRLCDEAVYKLDMKKRLIESGFQLVRTEVPLTVTHRDFSKTYFLDLVVDDCALYDLKVAKLLLGEHDAQAINYMLLLDLSRGKLLNFRPPKVVGRLLGTRLTLEKRRCFKMNLTHWRDLSPECLQLRETVIELLAHWGAFLHIGLYEEALTHFMGGEPSVIRRLNIERAGTVLGTHCFHVHSPAIAFRLSAITNSDEGLEDHLRRLLSHTKLKAIQWINLNKEEVQFLTITR
jgi:GxxExxY protein